jgi:DNA-binding winged helix-turn-helix (wHTH) protein
MAIVLRFDLFELDTRTLELRRAGLRVGLRPQPARLLRFLAERPGVLVMREELRDQLWSPGTFVRFDQGLNSCMRQVRAALGDRPERPRFIETLPRRGYRFLVPVSESVGEPSGVRRARVAVLPFETIEAGGAVPPLVTQGFEAELISRVVAVGSDRVALCAAPTFERGEPRSDAGERDADYVITGSIRRVDGRVRVAARLVSVHDRTHVWAQSFEYPLGHPFLWQDEASAVIAEAIVRVLDREAGS